MHQRMGAGYTLLNYCYVINKAKYLKEPKSLWLPSAEIAHDAQPYIYGHTLLSVK